MRIKMPPISAAKGCKAIFICMAWSPATFTRWFNSINSIDVATANGVVHRLHSHRGDAAVNDADCRRGGVGEIDNAPLGVRTAVVDFNLDGFAVLDVGHLGFGAQEQSFMRGSHLGFIEDFAGGGFFATETRAVP